MYWIKTKEGEYVTATRVTFTREPFSVTIHGPPGVEPVRLLGLDAGELLYLCEQGAVPRSPAPAAVGRLAA